MTTTYTTAPPGAAISAFAITKSDTTVISPPTNYVYVGGAGDLAVLMANDTVAVTLSAVPAGTLLSIRVQKVMSTNTTATLVIGMY